MKKNVLSILILALLVVNLVLTAIMMFSVTGAMKSTTALVGKIATVLDIELATDQSSSNVSVEDTATYTIADTMTIPLKASPVAEGEKESKDHYVMMKVTIYMNSKHEDYEKYGTVEQLVAREEMIKSEIISVVRSHTIEEFKADTEGVYAEIVAQLQQLYNSKFIYRVASGDVKYQ